MQASRCPRGLIVIDLLTVHRPRLSSITAIDRLVESGQYSKAIATRFENQENSLFRSVLAWRGATPPHNLLADFTRDAVLQKTGYGLSAEAVNALQETGIQEWHLCGITLADCLPVALSLWDNGLRPVVLESYCESSSSREDLAAAVLIRRYFGEAGIYPAT